MGCGPPDRSPPPVGGGLRSGGRIVVSVLNFRVGDPLMRLRSVGGPRLAALVITLAVGAGVAWWASAEDGVFTSPDESGNYLSARALAEEGSFRLAPHGASDPEGLLAPRAFVKVDEALAPIQFPIMPLLHAAGFAVSGAGVVSAG